MKVLDPGHAYELDVLDGTENDRTYLVFVKREGPHYPGNVGHHPGTNVQEVLRALIERLRYVNSQIPCSESQAAVECLRQALLLLEIRAARVKGRPLDVRWLHDIEQEKTCRTCGHIRCREHV